MDAFVVRRKRKPDCTLEEEQGENRSSKVVATSLSTHPDVGLSSPVPSTSVLSTTRDGELKRNDDFSNLNEPGIQKTILCDDPIPSLTQSQIDVGVVSERIFSLKPPMKPGVGEKKNILDNLFVPNASFQFPVTALGKKKLKFQQNWLQKWKWLSYSKEKDGAYCKYCVLFSSECLGKADQHVKCVQLIGEPFKKWKNAIERFNDHVTKEYHKFAVIAGDKFLEIAKGESEDILTALDNKRKKEKEENRSALLPIIETVIFCGENELPLRGDMDSGPLSLEKPTNKDGKFRSLLRYRATFDEKLRQRVLNCPKNATYISPDIQNQIISICGQLIQKKITSDVNLSDCFSIIADETLDIAGQEQLSICFRYVTADEKPTLREDFVTFFPLTDLSAENITENLLKVCRNVGVDLENKMIGQGYDGASTMSGSKSGVQTRIQEMFPKAMYVHCSSHRLNLVLSESLNVPFITNSLGVMKEVIQFFRHNTTAGNLLKENCTKFCPESKKSRLLKLCETRFIERQESVNNFVELFPAIVPSLGQLSDMNRSFSATASTLLAAMEKGSFVVSILVCEYIFNLTLPLSVYLQNPERDLSAAVKFCDDITDHLKSLRTGQEDEREFKRIFKHAESMAEFVLGTEIEVPRQAAKQTKRDNTPHSSSEQYYRRTIFLPAVDNIIVNLENRFDKNREVLSAIEVLLPKNCKMEKMAELEKLKIYFEKNTSQSALNAEYTLWCRKWIPVKEEDRPSRLMEVLDTCNKNFYPTVRYLLCVLATLPVSTCEAERSFSTLKRIKTYLRNRMGNERLTGLALLSAHYPVQFTAEDVLNVMATQGSRRLLM